MLFFFVWKCCVLCSGMNKNKIYFSSAVRESLFEVRLISPIQGFDFLGRVEVLYNNVWGTVCDYGFNSNAADVVCGMLNYTESACTVTNARMGKGSGEFNFSTL